MRERLATLLGHVGYDVIGTVEMLHTPRPALSSWR